MKKIFIAIMAMALPLMMSAQSKEISPLAFKANFKSKEFAPYAAKGAIPEENGKVAWKSVITAPGKSKDEIFNKLQAWASLRFEPNIILGDKWYENDYHANLEYAKVKSADKAAGTIECQGAEELIFTQKVLAKSFTQAFYLVDLKVQDGSVAFDLHTINYNVDLGDGEFDRVNAEDWITDAHALKKDGELKKKEGKFRVKTMDLVKQMIKEITEAIQ